MSIPLRPLARQALATNRTAASFARKNLRCCAENTLTTRSTPRPYSSAMPSSTGAAKSSDDPPTMPLTDEQRRVLDSALRVNHAGELAAVRIYAAQNPLLVRSHPHLRPLMQHMYDQEAGHFQTFQKLLAKHRIRPTAMYPVWTVAASVLGWSTAMMGREAAMACTEAVETEIGTHYNDQVRTLLGWKAEAEAKGMRLDGELEALLEDLRRIRDEELEHLDEAVANESKKADQYEMLTGVIRAGCRAAIKISEKV